MVWLGIGPAAEAFCRHCGDGVPCPKCRSTETEPFATYSWSVVTSHNAMHCVPCGHVFSPSKES